ncbi:unnamed protein product [Dicrocoelium dendriticum]|nr:unnamed protein product [Dicrocoelium dendriticum]
MRMLSGFIQSVNNAIFYPTFPNISFVSVPDTDPIEITISVVTVDGRTKLSLIDTMNMSHDVTKRKIFNAYYDERRFIKVTHLQRKWLWKERKPVFQFQDKLVRTTDTSNHIFVEEMTVLTEQIFYSDGAQNVAVKRIQDHIIVWLVPSDQETTNSRFCVFQAILNEEKTRFKMVAYPSRQDCELALYNLTTYLSKDNNMAESRNFSKNTYFNEIILSRLYPSQQANSR